MGSCSSTKRIKNPVQVTEPSSNDRYQETHMCQRKSISAKNLRLVEHNSDSLSLGLPHIKSLKISYAKYITTLETCYSLAPDTTMKHELMGTGVYKGQNQAIFEKDEYIIRLACYYDNVAITTLKILTSKDRVLQFGNEKKGPFRQEINLAFDNKYVIGFKGLVGEFLSDLWVYSTEFEEIPEESAHSTIVMGFSTEDDANAEKLWQELVST